VQKFEGPAPPRGRNIVSRKSRLGGSKLTCPTLWIVDQSSPGLFRGMREESFSITSFRFWISSIVHPDIFAMKGGSCVKLAQILYIFGPQLFYGRAPKFLDLYYKIDADADHAAKFRGDRPTELGDPVAN